MEPDRAAPIVYYDGGCGLCHRAVRFLLARDRRDRLRFAPLGGDTFEREMRGVDVERLPDSIVYRAPDGRILVRAVAVGALLEVIGGPWRIVGRIVGSLPGGDRLYDLVAGSRKRWFASPTEACPVPPGSLRRRFLP